MPRGGISIVRWARSCRRYAAFARLCLRPGGCAALHRPAIRLTPLRGSLRLSCASQNLRLHINHSRKRRECPTSNHECTDDRCPAQTKGRGGGRKECMKEDSEASCEVRPPERILALVHPGLRCGSTSTSCRLFVRV